MNPITATKDPTKTNNLLYGGTINIGNQQPVNTPISPTLKDFNQQMVQGNKNPTIPASNTAVSNYGMASKVNDIIGKSTQLGVIKPPVQPQTNQQAQNNVQTGQTIDYSTAPYTTDQFGTKMYYNPSSGQYDQYQSTGGVVNYGGINVPSETLSDPSLKAIIDNQLQAKQENKTALDSELEAIKNRFVQYRDTQTKLNQSSQAGVQNALLQSGAGGRGSVAQYAAATADARVNVLVEDGLKAIQQLDNQEKELISAARSAYASENFKILSQINSAIEQKRQEQETKARELNSLIAKEQFAAETAKKQATRDSAIADLYSQGITDPSKMLNYLNFDEQGNQIGDFTAKEIQDTMKNIASGLGTDVSGLDQTTKEFYRLKQAQGLPAYISSLPTEGEQLLSYVKARTGAESKALQKTTSGGKTVTTTTGTYIPPTDIEITDPFLQKLANSKGGRFLADTSIQKLDKAATVLSQLGVLQENIAQEDTGPIVGLMREKNPWDTKAQTIKAQLNAIIPNLARGVYGEVGVLTDQDIANYGKTLPNLQSTEEIRNAILYITLDMVAKSMRTTLDTNASAGRDVSGFVDYYRDLEKNKNSILSTIPNAKVPNSIKVKSGNSYTIQSGDELRNIAPKYGVTVETLMALNPGINPNNLKVGESINLPIDSSYGGYTLPSGGQQTNTFQGYSLPN